MSALGHRSNQMGLVKDTTIINKLNYVWIRRNSNVRGLTHLTSSASELLSSVPINKKELFNTHNISSTGKLILYLILKWIRETKKFNIPWSILWYLWSPICKQSHNFCLSGGKADLNCSQYVLTSTSNNRLEIDFLVSLSPQTLVMSLKHNFKVIPRIKISKST